MEWDDFLEQSHHRALTVITGVVHDLTGFISVSRAAYCLDEIIADANTSRRQEHPGGKALISSAIGRDATSQFNGGGITTLTQRTTFSLHSALA